MTKIVFSVAVLLFSWLSMAQEVHIKLLNSQTGEAFSGVHFKYGDAEGISNEAGSIAFLKIPAQTLLVSHVSLGKQYFSDDMVKGAILSGELRLEPHVQVLQPAVILAKGKANVFSGLQVTETDKVTHDAGAFLKQTPLIAAIQKGGNYGFDPVMRGFKYDQLNLVMDGGICATAACPNRMDPPSSQIPMNMIEQIEVLKGPYSLRYGTGFGGTINFKSLAGSYADITKVKGRISAGYEGNGTIYKTEGEVGISGRFYNISIYGSYSDGGNYYDGNDSLVEASFNRLNLGTRMNFQINSRNEISLNIANNFAKDVDFPALNMDLREDNTWLMSASHKYKPEEGSLKRINTSLFASFVDHEMDNLNKNLSPRMVNAVTDAITRNMGARSEALVNFRNGVLYTGLDFKQQTADGTRYRTFLMGPNTGTTINDNVWQDSRITEASVFGEYHHDFERSGIVASLRLNYNNAEAFNVSDRFSAANDVLHESQINPSLSIGYFYDLNETLSLGLWLGRAQRSGSLTERFINYLPVGRDPYERVGNPSLNAEVNNQIDLDLNWKTSSATIQINVFAAYLNDFISSEIQSDLSPLLSTAPGVKQYMNIGNALLTGAEVSWTHQWTDILYSSAALAYTYGENLEANTPLPEIAPLDTRFLIGANLLKKTLKPELSLRLVNEQNRIATSFGETVTPGYKVLDLMLNYLPVKNMQIKLGLANLFNAAYYEHLSRSVSGTAAYKIHAPGRSFYATVTYQF